MVDNQKYTQAGSLKNVQPCKDELYALIKLGTLQPRSQKF